MATAVKRKTIRKKAKPVETDGAYMLKLVLYMIVGSMWLKITTSGGGQVPIPIGFIVGVLFAMHDHFKIDRKIEYAMLLAAMFIGFWLPIGVFITL